MPDKESDKKIVDVRTYSADHIKMLTAFVNKDFSCYGKIGANIRSLRLLNKLTQEKAAEALNVSVGYLTLLERGGRALSMPVAVKLCLLFNCTLDDLFFYAEKNEHIDREAERRIVLECAVKEVFSDNDTEFFMTMIKAYRKAQRQNECTEQT